jgi:hypothetical protein
MTRSRNISTIGLRAKTGRAIAVALRGPRDTPSVISRRELSLVDAKIPATAQPYHEVMHLNWDAAEMAVRKTADAIQKVASRALGDFALEVERSGTNLRGAGVVGSRDSDLRKIGNFHIRAHAAEGQLFRRVLEAGADQNGLTIEVFVERNIYEVAAPELELSSSELSGRLSELGRVTGQKPWRADEKLAALAAWLVLWRS